MSIQTFPDHPILLVDDEAQALESFSIILDFNGVNNLLPCQDESMVMDILEKNDVEAVLLDMIMPTVSGESLLDEITLKYPDIPVIMITAVNDVQTAFRCMRKGAFDYLTKPADADQLASTVKRAIDHHSVKRQKNLLVHHILTDSLERPEVFSEIVTKDRKMMSLFMYCEAIARGNEPVLITGETGVGKGLFARAIHLASGRRGEFVVVNVAGVDDHAFSDTLSGTGRVPLQGRPRYAKGLLKRPRAGRCFSTRSGTCRAAHRSSCSGYSRTGSTFRSDRTSRARLKRGLWWRPTGNWISSRPMAPCVRTSIIG
jgi:DNA-binding NtrC family response regulator